MLLLVSRSGRTAAPRAALQKTTFRSLSSSPVYKPTLTERRVGESAIGGRSGEAGCKVAVFGASGFLGKYFSAELGQNAFMGYFANRGDDMEMRHIKVNFDLGRTRFVFYSPRDRESIKDVIADADVVVNLIGKFFESGQPVQTNKFPYVKYETNYSYHDTNVVIPRTLAEICREMQVDHFVHVSSASASPNSASEWSRTKYEGEQAIKEVYPWATIVRPTQIYGKEDRLLNWFARMAQTYGYVPLVDDGASLTQPVWVGDVAKALLRICDDPGKFEGRRVDCFGPADFTYKELAEFVDDITEREKPIIDIPKPIYKQLARVLQYQRYPLVSPDLVEQWSENFIAEMTAEEYRAQPDTADKIYTLEDLDIQAVPIEKEAFQYLHFYRHGGHFFRVGGYH